MDATRLGKQRVECIQVMRGLTVPTYGWRHHPAVLRWRGHLEALGRYTFDVCAVWVETGRADTCATTVATELAAADALPPWLGEPVLHRSHQSALVRKDPERYGPLFPGVPDDLPYYCPTSAT